MFTSAEKRMKSEQLYYVIQCMLKYEEQYNKQAFIPTESLESYIPRAFNQHNHYLQSGLENLRGTGILRLFLDSMPAAPARTFTTYGTSNSSTPLHATHVEAIPTVQGHAMPSMPSTAPSMGSPTSAFHNASFRSHPIPKIEVNHYHYGQRRNSGMSDFVMGFLMGRDSGRSAPAPTRSDNNSSKDGCLKNFFARLAALIIFMLAAGSLVYLAGQIKDMHERLIYNEGRAYALLSAAFMGASAVSSFFVSTSLVPLILLAAAASNPVSWAIFGVIAGTLILTATAHALLTQLVEPMLQDTFEAKFGSTSFVPGDLGRVQLTQAEATKLEKKNIDPMKVRCAIALIREKMGEEPIVNKWSVYALFDAEGARRGDNQKHLETIRNLRSGKITEVDVGERRIDVSSMTSVLLSAQWEGGNRFPDASAPFLGSDGRPPQNPDYVDSAAEKAREYGGW
jgi:hypothetical protein